MSCIRVIRTLSDLETVRAYWEESQHHVNSDLAQFELICQLRRLEIERPYVIVIEERNKPSALIIGRLERTRFAPAIGYLRPVKLSARTITVIHQGLLGHLDERAARECIEYLWSLLGTGVADAIQFHNLSEHSPLFRALLAYGSRWFCEKSPSWSVHWEMTVPSDGKFMDTKMRSKHRSWIRRKERDLELAFPGKISWVWMTHFDDIPGLCNHLEGVAAQTYQRGLGAGFFNNEEYHQRFALFASRGQLRVQLLKIDGTVRAFWFGILYDNVFHSSETGYDPKLREYEVGTLMFIRMSDELTREGATRLDFGIGDALYKQRFGDISWREATFWMFAPTARGVALRTLLKLFGALDYAARTALRKMGLVERLKTRWRQRVAKVTEE